MIPGVKGDLVVQLVPEPLPALSTGSQDQELDVTLEELASRETESSPSSTEQDGRSSEQETCARGEGEPEGVISTEHVIYHM